MDTEIASKLGCCQNFIFMLKTIESENFFISFPDMETIYFVPVKFEKMESKTINGNYKTERKGDFNNQYNQ